MGLDYCLNIIGQNPNPAKFENIFNKQATLYQVFFLSV